MAPEDLPATDGHNRPVALGWPDGEEPRAAPEWVSCNISRQEQGEHVFRKWATRRITGSRKPEEKAQAQMIGEVGELRNWGPIQQLLRRALRQRRTEIG